MKFYFLKYNFTRQLLMYLLIIMFAVFAYFSFADSLALAIVFLTCLLLFSASLIFQYFNYVLIDELGIEYHSLFREYRLHWNEIGQIKIINRWNRNTLWPWIIILKSSKRICSKRLMPTTEKENVLRLRILTGY